MSCRTFGNEQWIQPTVTHHYIYPCFIFLLSHSVFCSSLFIAVNSTHFLDVWWPSCRSSHHWSHRHYISFRCVWMMQATCWGFNRRAARIHQRFINYSPGHHQQNLNEQPHMCRDTEMIPWGLQVSSEFCMSLCCRWEIHQNSDMKQNSTFI